MELGAEYAVTMDALVAVSDAIQGALEGFLVEYSVSGVLTCYSTNLVDIVINWEAHRVTIWRNYTHQRIASFDFSISCYLDYSEFTNTEQEHVDRIQFLESIYQQIGQFLTDLHYGKTQLPPAI